MKTKMTVSCVAALCAVVTKGYNDGKDYNVSDSTGNMVMYGIGSNFIIMKNE